MRSEKNALAGCLCALGCEILFGFSYLFTKDATDSASVFAAFGLEIFDRVHCDQHLCRNRCYEDRT